MTGAERYFAALLRARWLIVAVTLLVGGVAGRLEAGHVAHAQKFIHRVEGDGEVHNRIIRTNVLFVKRKIDDEMLG